MSDILGAQELSGLVGRANALMEDVGDAVVRDDYDAFRQSYKRLQSALGEIRANAEQESVYGNFGWVGWIAGA